MSESIMHAYARTKNALLWMSLSNEPFVVLYALIPFILRKELGISLTQLSILASLRPVLSIFSFYWSARLTNQRHRLRQNLMSAWLLARLPFLFVPWIDHSWYLIFCCALYELLNKSGNPAFIEILKINLAKDSRENLYTLCFVLSFLESILLGFLIGGILNSSLISWQILLGFASLIGLTSLFAQMQIPIPPPEEKEPLPAPSSVGKILLPWKDALKILKNRPQFFRFQCGFMIGGIGLMLATPSVSLFFVDVLQLSHGEISMGKSILMGVGVTLSSYLWKQMLAREQTENLLRNILIGFGFYLFSLYLASFYLFFFYFAHILYGIAQSGSHLLWNLSGPIFAGTEDSSQFSRVNILMVGLRGAITPALGGLLCSLLGPIPVIVIGSFICFGGACFMYMTKEAKMHEAEF